MADFSYSPFRSWLAITTLALSIFTVVSTEMLPIGLLTPIAQSFLESEGKMSFIIFAPAFVAALSALIIPFLFASTNRKKLLLILMALLLIANVLSAIAPNKMILLAARILLGISMGGIWTVAGGLANRIVPSKKVALATSIIFSGVAAASVFGIPLGVYLGDLINWQFAVIVMAILTACLIFLLAVSLPTLPTKSGKKFSDFPKMLQSPLILQGLIITLLLVAGHFMSYTFIRPLLQTNAGFVDSTISSLLFAYGLFGILGNFILGNLASRYLKQTIAFIALSLTFSLWLLLFLSHSQISTILILALWGFAYGAVSVSLMNWMFRASPDNIEIATAFYITIFNFAIACGALFGGKVYDFNGLNSTLFIAGALTIGAFLLLFFNPQKKNI